MAAEECHIVVGCRVRPLNAQELELGNACVWSVSHDGKSLSEADVASSSSSRKSKLRSYDYVFDQEHDNNSVYEALGQPILAGVLDGFNGCVFAYGQTASGKTHTLLGSPEDMGIIIHTVSDLFEFVSRAPKEREFLVRVSYLEIYNEEIKDLLAATPAPAEAEEKEKGEASASKKGPASASKRGSAARALKVVEDPKTGACQVQGLKSFVVLSPDHVLQLLKRGEEKRHYGATNMNYTSSRSHTVFRVVVESRQQISGTPGAGKTGETGATGATGGGEVVQVSELNLVDLAGSERVAKTAATGVRLKEGSAINKSLLALGTVINKLADGVGNGRKSGHVPYRDSKLTRLLSKALGGNSRTALVCTLSPAERNIEESRCSLLFASRAKTVVNSAKQNHVADKSALLDQYRQEIADLRLKLAAGSPVDAVPGLDQIRLELHAEAARRAELETKCEHDQEELEEMRKLVLLASKASASPAVASQLQERVRAVASGEMPPKVAVEQLEQLVKEAETLDADAGLHHAAGVCSFAQVAKVLNLKRSGSQKRRLSTLAQGIVGAMAEQRTVEAAEQRGEANDLWKAHLGAKNAALDQRLAELGRSNAALEARVAAQVDELKVLGAKAEGADEESEAMCQSKAALEVQVEELLQARKDLGEKVGELERRNVALEQQARDAVEVGRADDGDKAKLSTELVDVRAALEEATIQSSDLRACLSSRAELLDSLQLKVKAKDAGMREAAAARDAALRDRDAANKEVAVARAENKALQMENARVTGKVDDLERERSVLAQEKTALEGERARLQESNVATVLRQEEQLAGLLDQLQAQQARSKQQLHSQQEQLADFQAKAQQYEAQIGALGEVEAVEPDADRASRGPSLSEKEARQRQQLQALADGVETEMSALLEKVRGFSALDAKCTALEATTRRLLLSRNREHAGARTDELPRPQPPCERCRTASLAAAARPAAVPLPRALLAALPATPPAAPLHPFAPAPGGCHGLQAQRETALVRENQELKAQLAVVEAEAATSRGRGGGSGPRDRDRDMALVAEARLECEDLADEASRLREGLDVHAHAAQQAQAQADALREELRRKEQEVQQLSAAAADGRQDTQERFSELESAALDVRDANRRLARELRATEDDAARLEQLLEQARAEAARATETFLQYQRAAEAREEHLRGLAATASSAQAPEPASTLPGRMDFLREQLAASAQPGSSSARYAAAEPEEQWHATRSGAVSYGRQRRAQRGTGELVRVKQELARANDELDVFHRLDVYSTSMKRCLREHSAASTAPPVPAAAAATRSNATRASFAATPDKVARLLRVQAGSPRSRYSYY